MGGQGSGRKPGMSRIFDAPKSGTDTQFSEGQKSKGLLDDFAERQNIDTAEGTIQKTPVNAKDIVNKAYADSHAPTSHALNSHTQGSDKIFHTKGASFTEISLGADGTYLKSGGSGEDLEWGSPLENVSEDTTPELGGEMDAGAHTIGFTQQSATGDGTTTIDWRLGNKFYFTFGAQNDTFTFTAPSNPCNLILVLKQDGTGSRIPTFPGTVLWSGGSMPTFSTGVAAVDIVAFYYDGTNYFGVETLDFSI